MRVPCCYPLIVVKWCNTGLLLATRGVLAKFISSRCFYFSCFCWRKSGFVWSFGVGVWKQCLCGFEKHWLLWVWNSRNVLFFLVRVGTWGKSLHGFMRKTIFVVLNSRATRFASCWCRGLKTFFWPAARFPSSLRTSPTWWIVWPSSKTRTNAVPRGAAACRGPMSSMVGGRSGSFWEGFESRLLKFFWRDGWLVCFSLSWRKPKNQSVFVFCLL